MAEFDFTTLITDRSAADTQELQSLKAKWQNGTITEAEKNKWIAGLKGAYNASDLNRVANALYYFEEVLAVYGYTAPINPLVLNSWSAGVNITKAYWDAYFETIIGVADMLPLPIESTPGFKLPESLSELNINTANNIEKMLLSLREVVDLILPGFIYSGEAYSGEF